MPATRDLKKVASAPFKMVTYQTDRDESCWHKKAYPVELGSLCGRKGLVQGLLWPEVNNAYKDNIKQVIKKSILKYTGFEYFLLDKYAEDYCFVPDMVKLQNDIPQCEFLLKFRLLHVYGKLLFKGYNWKGVCGVYNMAEKDKHIAALPLLPLYMKDIKRFGPEIAYGEFLCMKRFSDRGLYLPREVIAGINALELRDCRFTYTDNVYSILVKVPDLTAVKCRRILKYCNYQFDRDEKFNGIVNRAKFYLRDYNDYLKQCEELNLNMLDEAVLMPFNFHAAHEDLSLRIGVKRSAELDKAFKAKMESLSACLKQINARIAGKVEGLAMVAPISVNDLIREGKENKTCVGTYGQWVADGSSLILFIRTDDAKDKPYCTLELNPKNGRILQCRAFSNLEPPEPVWDLAKMISKEYGQAIKSLPA